MISSEVGEPFKVLLQAALLGIADSTLAVVSVYPVAVFAPTTTRRRYRSGDN